MKLPPANSREVRFYVSDKIAMDAMRRYMASLTADVPASSIAYWLRGQIHFVNGAIICFESINQPTHRFTGTRWDVVRYFCAVVPDEHISFMRSRCNPGAVLDLHANEEPYL